MMNFLNGAGIEAEIDKENKTLKVSSNNWNKWGAEDGFTYNLDGWTGRYGTPIEFILSLHLATMSSGFVEELLTHPDLKTNVDIELNKVDCSVEYKLKDSNGNEILYCDEDKSPLELFNKYVNNETINKDDITILSIIELINGLELQTKYYNNYIYQENDTMNPLLGTGKKFNGLQKNLDAMNAIVSTNSFAVSVNNTPIEDSDGAYGIGSSYGSTGTYLCDLDANGEFDSTTGILSTISTTEAKDDAEKLDEAVRNFVYQYEKDSNGNYIYKKNGENVTEIGNKYDLYKDNSKGITWIELEGFGNYSATALTIMVSNALAYKGNDVEKFMSDLKADIENVNISSEGAQFSNNATQKNAYLRLVAYGKTLKQIDEFVVGYAVNNMIDVDTNTYCIPTEKLNELDNKFNYRFVGYAKASSNYANGGYYTSSFLSCCQTTAKQESGFNSGIYFWSSDATKGNKSYLNELKTDMQTISNHFANNSGQKVREILDNAGYSNLDLDEVRKVYGAANFSNEDVNWVEARITKVIKHWYKDISYNKAYTLTKETKEVPYTKDDTGLDTNEYVITAVITPEEEYHQQTSQPYVVKGEKVYLDGEFEGSVEEQGSNLGSTGDKNYNWGDGYRATKKIFTEGFYYCYDGSEDTAASIYYQEQIIEKMTNATYTVRVEDGRIVAMPANDIENIENKIVYNKYGITITRLKTIEGGVYDQNGKRIGTAEEEQDIAQEEQDTAQEGNNDNVTVRIKPTRVWYRIGVNNSSQPLKYLSTASEGVSYKQAQKRVEVINEVWDAMGVTVKRQPLSFDNTGSDGTMMALSAFSILENCKTEDAEHIYRDLKELLIELGYFTKAEFEYLSTDVLEWFIPGHYPQGWPMNKTEDYMEYGVFVYPYENEDTNKDGETEEENGFEYEGVGAGADSADKEEKESEGFQPDLEVIAPGTCVITDYDIETSEITIKFNGVEQPEIAILNDYKMIIKGIKVNETIVLADSEGKVTENTVSIASAKENSTIIPVGSIIGKTGTEKIQVVMINNRRAYINNVQDYMNFEDTQIVLENDYNVFTESGENVIKDVETFKKMFSEYKVICDNAEAFMEMQETYKVNAVFAASVCIVESSAGTNGNLVGKGAANSNDTGYPYNMFSITAWGSKALSEKRFYWTNSAASTWMAYDSFEQAILDFGNYIANSNHYFAQDKYMISEIGPTYCNANWSVSVSKVMTQKLEKLLEGN